MIKMIKLPEEQIERLKKSKYVVSVNENQVNFTDEFKQLALQEWNSGVCPKEIFDKYDIGYAVLGGCRSRNNLRRWEKQESRLEGFQRIKGSGRPKKPTFSSVEEENKYLKDQLEYQRQEIEFLKKLKALEVKYQRKKNTK